MKTFLPALAVLFAGGAGIGAATSERLRVGAFERPRIQASERQASPTLQRSDTQTLRRTDIQTLRHSDAAADLPLPPDETGPGLLDELRRPGPAAYRRHVATLLTNWVSATPGAERWILDLLRGERDPAAADALLGVLSGYYAGTRDPAVREEMTRRLADPVQRLTAVKFLCEVPDGPDDLSPVAALATDADPAVREAALAGLLRRHESHLGRNPEILLSLVDVAGRTADPAAAGRILSRIDLSHAPGAAGRVRELAASPSPEVRIGAAGALGSAGPAEVEALEAWYRRETDPAVRRSLIAATARAGLARSLPALERMRGEDPALDAEIDAYAAALRDGGREWRLVKRRVEGRAAGPAR